MGGALEMHAAHCPAPACAGVVYLRYRFLPACNRQLFGTEQSRQEPSAVAQSLALDKLEARQRQVSYRESAHAMFS
jgi:hypothetical protein